MEFAPVNNIMNKTFELAGLNNDEKAAMPTFAVNGKIRKDVLARIRKLFGEDWNKETPGFKKKDGTGNYTVGEIITNTLTPSQLSLLVTSVVMREQARRLGVEPSLLKKALQIARGMSEAVMPPFYANELGKKDEFKQLYATLIGLRESLKLHHLSTNSWQDHLATDKAYDGIDDLIDTLGEVYFLPRGIDMRDIKIADDQYNAKDPAALAMAVNAMADNLANSIDDNGLINYLNGLSQEMQIYVGWLRLGMKDGLQDTELDLVTGPKMESRKNVSRKKTEAMDNSDVEHLARTIVEDDDVEIIGSLADATVGDYFLYMSPYWGTWLSILVLGTSSKREALAVLADRVRSEMRQGTDWEDGNSKRNYKKLPIGGRLDGWLKISDGDNATLIAEKNLRQYELSGENLEQLRKELESRSNKYKFVPTTDPRQTLMFGESAKKSRMRAFAESVLNA